MDEYRIIRTLPGDLEHRFFEQLVTDVYEEGSPRFSFGNDPQKEFLEGCYTLLKNHRPIARAAFYENPYLEHKGLKAACFGSFESVDDSIATCKLLDHIKSLARSKNYKSLLGPMEGSTWNNYRWSVSNDKPNFFLEPYNHAYYNDLIMEYGFEKIARYRSNLDENIEAYVCETAREDTFKKNGWKARTICLDNAREELSLLAKLSIEGFSKNTLYTPISEADFVAKYSGLTDLFDPDLIWILENEKKEIQAFLFAIKDYNDNVGKTVILKSVVRRKDSVEKGLAKFLAAKLAEKALEKGYTRIIHAFMLDENVSRTLSDNLDNKLYKSYALYGLEL